MSFTRRDLLSKGALLVASGLVAPSFITRTALALAQAQQPAGRNRVLVIVQLSGGNDGLNTLVPFADPEYYKLRSSLAVPANSLLPITDFVGLHPQLPDFKVLYDQGTLAIVQGVGYPNPSRSHFRSMDIWHSARPDSFERSGWLGRYLDACQCGQTQAVPAISVGDQLNSMFWTDATLVPAVANIGAFTFRTETNYRNDRQAQLQTLQNIYAQAGNWPANETMIRKATLRALAGSDQLQDAAAAYRTPVQYPVGNPLANQLQMVAQVIAGDLGARLFSVQMGGFDTHATQQGQHEGLLGQVAAAIAAFQQDLALMNKQDDVVLVTFSEFGRRPLENGSLGTDHGTAEPMFIVGSRVRGGLYGTYPSLGDLDENGDLKFTADFRSVYAGVLRDHMGIDPTPVLVGQFEPLSVLPPVTA
ncbi:MAG TPA: DUF1501 domain-containing protein [Chloroflexota bacterium]|jgi:uncharacterized protein (DUF1501 family)